MTSVLRFLGFGLLALFLLALPSAQAQGPTPQATLGSAFTYQGFLADGGAPANGTYDFQFSLFDAAGGGTQVGATLTLNDVTVTDGRFTVQLDFGNVFTGSALWLQVSVRPGASTGSYTTLSPRQALTPAPYALYALKIPLAGSGSAATAAHSDHDHFGQIWSGSAAQGLRADNTSTTGVGLYGSASSTSGFTRGVYGRSDSTNGTGVYGFASATSGYTYGVYGRNVSTNGYGVVGYATATAGPTSGVLGRSDSTDGRGVYGLAFATSGTTYGVYGKSYSPSGTGVYGSAPTTGTVGIATATTGVTYGVYGKSYSPSGRGVYGSAPLYGVFGYATSPYGRGVSGVASATSGYTYGVLGRSDSTDGRGVAGVAYASSGTTIGVYGASNSPFGRGVYGSAPTTGTVGIATATTGVTYGVYGRSNSPSGRGVYGTAPHYGVYGLATATSGTTFGVYGASNSPFGRGVYGTAPHYGVYGYATSTSGAGVYGYASATSGFIYGVYGISESTDGRGVAGVAAATSGFTYGVYGWNRSPSGYAVYGYNSAGGYAGYFDGNVHVLGNFSASGTKSFKIDHPLDPANRYLLHFAQEAPQVQNVYNGVVTLDAHGQARVLLPPYFSALNTGPFRYQLTPIGAAMPDLHIAQEIQNNAFLIAGGVPGMKVSWEVTAVRNDPYLRDHPVQAEVPKPAAERGTYLYPEGYGQPASKGLDARHRLPEEQPAPADR